MDKERFFSKLNIKDYNNELEKILERKSFSESAKNTLLNILYKLEIAFEDYNKVKCENSSKKELLEEIIRIIEEKCDEIEFVKPRINEETKLGDKKYIIEKGNGKIISYPNEKSLFFALCNMENEKFVINNRYDLIKEPMELLLNLGYIMNLEEIIRDFDGWTWNIVSEEIENYSYNVIYQNIKILLGEKFLKNCISNLGFIDFIDKFEKKIESLLKKEKAENIINGIYKIAILEYVRESKIKQRDLKKTEKQLKEQLGIIENKKQYLQSLANKKKLIGKDIKQIDEIINNNKLLREEFIKNNENLPETEKIFSLSEYSEILHRNRKKLLNELQEYSSLMKPMNYVKNKSELQKKVDLLENIKIDSKIPEQINRLIVNLQKDFLNALNERIDKIEDKKTIINYIYLFRYYKLLPINEQEKIQNVEELKEFVIQTEKRLITRACNLKSMNIICTDIEKNYEIISRILSSNIIDLEEINIEIKKKKEKIFIEIYDDSTIDSSIECDNLNELNIKFNRRIKLFI